MKIENSISFTTFINNNHPVYEGINQEDGKTVKIVLSKWKEESNFGLAEIYPYTISSMHPNTDPHTGCFDLNNNVIKFTEDDYAEQTALTLQVADDFQSLTIIDRISKKALSTLMLKQ